MRMSTLSYIALSLLKTEFLRLLFWHSKYPWHVLSFRCFHRDGRVQSSDGTKDSSYIAWQEWRHKWNGWSHDLWAAPTKLVYILSLQHNGLDSREILPKGEFEPEKVPARREVKECAPLQLPTAGSGKTGTQGQNRRPAHPICLDGWMGGCIIFWAIINHLKYIGHI